MLLTVSEFCLKVAAGINNLISELEQGTSRNMTSSEKRELMSSYAQVSKLLTRAQRINPAVGYMHITSTNMLMEYKLPMASAWCDLVLLGDDDQENHQVYILELKNWRKNSNDQPGKYVGSIIHNGEDQLHPSEQVKGYVEYCRYFHSAIRQNDLVKGCVFFTQDIDLDPYSAGVNAQLVQEYPVYNTVQHSSDTLAHDICNTIKQPNEEFSKEFENGIYKQNRNILLQVAENLNRLDSAHIGGIVSPFVLLEQQRSIYNKVMEELDTAAESGEKHVFIVKGNPGSGKSAIAANLWVNSVLKYKDRTDKNITFVTTSQSQDSNWTRMFSDTGVHGAGHMILKASDFKPRFKIIRNDQDLYNRYQQESSGEDSGGLDKTKWRDYLRFIFDKGYYQGYQIDNHFLSIVDEAHALADPEKTNGMIMGWPMKWAGPMAYHIINCSRISVFFMEDRQGFRDREQTTVEDVKNLCNEMGIGYSEIELKMQFRCSGSQEYIDWVDSLCSPSPISNHDEWENQFTLEIVDYPSEVEEWLMAKRTKSVRLMSSYSRNWVSADTLRPMHDTDAPYDFDLPDKEGARYHNYWNYGGNQKYYIFVQGLGNTILKENPLAEVGCPYVVRGFDYDYVGIFWLEDLVRRGDKWVVNLDYNFESGNKMTRFAAKAELKKHWGRRDFPNLTIDGMPACDELRETVFQAYRIILTRANKGVCLYIKDPETREYVKSLLL